MLQCLKALCDATKVMEIWGYKRYHLGPDFFWPQEIWSESCMKIIIWHFRAGTKFLGVQISWESNFSEPQKTHEIGGYFFYNKICMAESHGVAWSFTKALQSTYIAKDK